MRTHNPPAFPRPASKSTASGRPEAAEPQEGLSLRDYFAAHALAALVLRGDAAYPEVLARGAYELADAMLAARAAE